MRAIDADALTNKYGNWYVEEGPEEGFIGDLKHLIDAQPTIVPESHWIPCSDASKLPKDRTFWVTHTNGYESWVDELYWDMTEWSDRISDVVAYMPCNIPEPYREGE